VRPAQAIATRIWRGPDEDDRAKFFFDAAEASGTEVIRHGLAEVTA